jgi:hypothetical protein
MDLLERYLQAVKFFLPRKQQDDIVRELSENLISQIEDRQDALGRPLTDDELAEILRRHGHPMIVAARYQSRQQLIGPTFFPIYRFALKLGIGVSLLVTVVVATISALMGDPVRHAVEGMLAFPGRALMVFAWTTLSFAGLDMAAAHVRLSPGWDPRDLPKVVRHEYQIPRGRTMIELFFAVLVVVWLVLVPWAPQLLMGPAAALLEPAPIWRVAYVPILLQMLATVALHVVNLVRPYWTRSRSVARLAISSVGLLVLAILLSAGEWFLPAATSTLPATVPVARIVPIINNSVHIGLIVAVIIGLVDFGRELHRLRNRRNPPVTSDSAPAHLAH